MDVFVSFGEDVGLNIASLGADELDINFIQIITLIDKGANNTLTRRSLHDDFNFPPENVKLRLNGWSIPLGLNSHVHPVVFITDPGRRGDDIHASMHISK